MCRLVGKFFLCFGLIALFIIGSNLPAQAQFTKVYTFTNNTGSTQTSVRAITLGLESIIYQFSDPAGWTPASVGFAVIGGVFSTTMLYSDAAASGSSVTIAWRTADNSCRLRDLRWGNGQPIVPSSFGGVPGGGLMFYDYPNPGDLTIIITNDTDGVLSMTDIEHALAGTALDVEDLSFLTSADMVEMRVLAIDEDIDVLRAEVEYYGSVGVLPSPSANSLISKLDKAEALKHDALDKLLSGDLDKALFLWNQAAKQIDNFISQVKNTSDKGNLPDSIYDRWVVDGDGEITTAPEILDALLALPTGISLQELAPLPTGVPLPSDNGLDPAGYQPWPVDVLNPGEFTAFVVPLTTLGSGFIMRGSIVDAAGNHILDWSEQGVAEPMPIDMEAPVIVSASATPSHLWPPDHSMVEISLDVTVTDNVGAIWYIEDVTSNQPEDGSGDGDCTPDILTDPLDLQAVSLRAERSGNDPTGVRIYTVTLVAIDMAGNVSEPYELLVPVQHDSGS